MTSAAEPLVSILMPAFNAEEWIASALESALQQTYARTEIIVIDDGSTDGTPEVLRAFGAKIRWHRTPNRGGNAARNELLALSQGTHIQYLDADDILHPRKIEAQVKAAEQNPAASIILDSMKVFRNDEPDAPPSWIRLQQPFDWWIELVNGGVPYTSAALWVKSELLRVGAWDENLRSGQEYDLYFRILASGGLLIYEGLNLTYFRMPPRDAEPKRPPVDVLTARSKFIERIQAWLENNGGLTDERRVAISEAQLLLARRLWQWDTATARRVERLVSPSDISPSVHQTGLPRGYRTAYRILGFTAAEELAALARNVRSIKDVRLAPGLKGNVRTTVGS